MVCEVPSPGNTKFDRTWEPRRYADDGIPFYLEVELDGAGTPRMAVFRPRGRGYVRIAEARAGETLEPTEPYDIRFDRAEFAGRRG
jgi:hypothetical protein